MSALFRWVTLRHLLGEAPRTLLTLAGVALGVGLFVSIRLAGASAMRSFSDTVDAVAGRANLQITSDTDGFDERLFTRVRGAPGVIAATPVVEQYVAARGGPPPVSPARPALEGAGRRAGYDETLLLLGLDLLGEGRFARFRLPAAGAGAPRDLITDARGVAITRTLASRWGLANGDTITVLSAGRPEVLRVRRILDSEAFQHAFGGHVIVTDIGVAQTLFHRIGRLDRVDLIVDPAHAGAVADSLRGRLPGSVHVGTPAARTRQVENMVRAFALNLTALSFIAVFVAGFLVFNAISMAVLRRRREIAVLRALGVTRGRTLRLFLAEAFALGVAGGALGIVLGILFARVTLGAITRTLSDLYLVRQAGHVVVDAPTLLYGMLIAVGIAWVAAWAPAREAAGTPPAHTMRQGPWVEVRPLALWRWTLLGVALLLAGGLSALWTISLHRPTVGFVAAFFVLAGFSCLAPGFTLWTETLATRPLGAVFGVAGSLGARYLREAVARTSVIIAAVMVSVGMMVALSIMVGSFRRTVDVWIGQSVRGDLYVEPVGHRLSLGTTVLPDSLIAGIRRLPGVAAVDSYRGVRVPIEGRVAFVAGVDFAVQARYGRLQLMHGTAREALVRALDGDGVIVTESFHHHYGVGAGDSLALPTPSGVARLPIAGVYYDYTTDAGAVLMDAGLFARLWDDRRTESLALYLEGDADATMTRERVLALAGPNLLLEVVPNRTLRERVLKVFDQTFQITYGLQAIAILVSVLGVVAALTALILQRGREIGVLRASGARRGQIRTMVLVESGLLGLVGSLLGSACGLVLALVLVHVINRQFFGWSIRMTVEPSIFVQTLVLMVGTAIVAGLGPARLAANRVAAEAMRME